MQFSVPTHAFSPGKDWVFAQSPKTKEEKKADDG
jgi:hypothetical protein